MANATDTPSSSLRAIAAFEASKGVLALLAAGGLHLLGPTHLQRAADALAHALRLPPDVGASGWIARAINPETLLLATGLAIAYGLMRLVEAWGLRHNRAWAVWFGTLSCAAYIPFELFSMLHHPHWLTLVVIAINVLIVWVLGRDLWRRSGRSAA